MTREVAKWDYELRNGEQVADIVDRTLSISMSERGVRFTCRCRAKFWRWKWTSSRSIHPTGITAISGSKRARRGRVAFGKC
jgi:hypothetical protein